MAQQLCLVSYTCWVAELSSLEFLSPEFSSQEFSFDGLVFENM